MSTQPIPNDFARLTESPTATTTIKNAPASVTNEAYELPAVSKTMKGIEDARDEMNGATVHSFDPAASPEEKASQTLKGAASVAPVSGAPLLNESRELLDFKASGGSELPSDVGTSSTASSQSEGNGLTSIGGVAESQLMNTEGARKDVAVVGAEERLPGTMPVAPVKLREIPEWFQIGWNNQNKEEDPFATLSELRSHSILSEFVSESYYGQWWHNAGIIIFAVLASHFFTLFGGGIASLLVIIAFCSTYYTTSIKRTRRNARDDMAREVAKRGLVSDVESTTWLNLFMTRFWLIYEPVLSATIVASVDQVLSVSTPAFLDSIRMTTFTLGTKPPHIDHVRTFPDTEDDIVLMEWKISFTPSDIMDMTLRAHAKQVNPKIVLNVRIGAGVASVGKDIIVQDIAFEGTMRVKIKLMNNFPHVQLVDLSFMAPPKFDFVLKPVGFDLSIIPGLTPFINSQVHATLGPMFYDPNVFTLDLEQLMSGAPIDTACGVLAITIYGARSMRGVKLGGGAPDPYITISVASRAILARTGIKKNTVNPNWNETKYILLNNLNEVLTLTAKDWNEVRKDADLGSINFDLASLKDDGQQENIVSPVMLDGKARGELKFDAIYFPVLTPKTIDGVLEVLPETQSGVVRLTIHQAKDLDPRGRQINPYAEISLNHSVIHKTQTLKRSPNPIFEHPTEFLVTNRSLATIGVTIRDDTVMSSDTSLGHVQVKLEDLLTVGAKEGDWHALTGANSGRLRFSAQWRPIMMTGALNGSGKYTAPIGVARLWFKRGRDIKNVEALTGGKSDPYVRVLRNGIILARTLVINNDLEPKWDEILYVPVHSAKDVFTVEVMDYQHMTKDRSLGTSLLDVAPLIAVGTDKVRAPYLSTGKANQTTSLRSGAKSVVKGSIEFEAEFYPAAHLKSSTFNEVVSSTITEEVEEDGSDHVSKEVATASTVATPAETPARSATPESAISGSVTSTVKVEGIVMSRAEILKAPSGLLVFQIVSGELSRKGRIEVSLNSGYWPDFSTEVSRSTHAVFDQIGEAFVREKEMATIAIKLNTAEKDSREEIIASYTVELVDFLDTCLDKPSTFILTDDHGNNKSTVRICAKYIPVEIVLEARESVNNSGIIRVDLIDAKGLPAADRSGKSDPFALFELNGVKVHKSEVVKKNLNPVWNEHFEISVPSRIAAQFNLRIFDWDRLGADTALGSASIDLASLEPFESTEMSVALTDNTGHASHAGTVRLKVVFRPGFIIRTRQATSTFSHAGRTGTVVLGAGAGALGAGVGAGAKGIGGVGKGILSGVKKVGGGFHGSSHDSTPPVPIVPHSLSADVVPPRLSSLSESPVMVSVVPRSDSESSTNIQRPAGTLRVTIVGIEGVGDAEEKKLITIRNNGKVVESTRAVRGESAQFNESFTIKTSHDPVELAFTLLHKKVIGSDKILGTCVINPFGFVQPPGSMSGSVTRSFTGGSGSVHVEFEWSHLLDDDRVSVADSISPSKRAKNRFSFARGSRETSQDE